MKFSPLHVSLMALALFATAGQGSAAGPEQQTMLLAQADTAEAPAQDFTAIEKFLAGTQDVSRLGDEKLQQRLSRAKKLRDTEGLPPELDQQLAQRIAELEAEISRRQEAAQQAPAEEQAPVQEQAQAEQPQVEQPPLPEATQDTPAEEPAPKPRKRKKQTEAAQQEAQPQPEVQQEAPQPEAQPQVTEAPAEQPAAQPEASGGSEEVAAFLQTVRPASELSEDELRQQMRRATELASTPGISADQRQSLRNVIREARTTLRNQAQGQTTAEQPATEAQPPAAEQPAPEAQAQQPAAEQPAPEQPAAKAEATSVPPPQVDPATEEKARAFLNDNVDVSTMERKELRRRLTAIRDLLATNQLSPETSDALRAKLAAERTVLRNKVSAAEGDTTVNATSNSNNTVTDTTNNTTTNNTTVNNTTTNNTVNNTSNNTTNNTVDNSVTNNSSTVVNNNTTVNNTEVRVVLQDRRPPTELGDNELVRRIDVYRQVVSDEDYSEEDRRMWERQMARDRRILRERMLEERRQREARLRAGEFEMSIDLEDNYEPDRRVPRSVFAAEADDEEIAGVLAAPPRRKVERRYTVEEIERSPAARDAVARIEIDTVHFGFGEGFLREEEIDKLDRIAQVLEKILAKNPDEVFLLEGHTDAVGSDAANLALSRQRAEAVKEALTTYYVIPAENLKTAGLGERYLKIPTQQPEAENRRVSLARITALVGRR